MCLYLYLAGCLSRFSCELGVSLNVKKTDSNKKCVTGVGFRWRSVGDMTGWLGSSVVECSHGQRKALGSSPGRATIFHLLHMPQHLYNIIQSLTSIRTASVVFIRLVRFPYTFNHTIHSRDNNISKHVRKQPIQFRLLYMFK